MYSIHLVDLNGNIARLESVELAEDNTSSTDKKRKALEVPDLPNTHDTPDNSCSSNKGKVAAEVVPTIDWEKCEQELVKLLDENHGRELISFLQQHENSTGEAESKDDKIVKFYTLPAISDKENRRSIHQLIKSPAFNSVARADNSDGKIRIWHKKFESDMPADSHGGDRNRNNGRGGGERGGGGGRSSTPWPKDRPDFLRFVLYKENVDTTTAAKDVVRMARLNPSKSINYAGMKDKRGITTQFCSIYRMEKETLLAVNSIKSNAIPENTGGCGNTTSNGSSMIKLGNFEYSSEEVKLGALTGNRFDVVLRNVDIGEVSVGSGNTRRQNVLEICKSAGTALKTNGFVNYFGMQRFGKYRDTHLVGIAVLKGDFEAAIDIIMGEKPDEHPRIAEARKQWANRFASIDLSKEENAGKAAEAERRVARAIHNALGRFLNCEKSIVSSLAQKPRDYKRAFSSISKNMRSMFLHAYQSYLFNLAATERIESGGSTQIRVGDLVLIEDKSLGVEGGGTSGLKGKTVKVLDERDLLTSMYSITDVVLPLVGTKILYPGGPSGNIFDELMKRDGISKEGLARIGTIDREISMCGDFRKLICKPSDVEFEVKQYQNPLQPLLQTDLMRVNGIDVVAKSTCIGNGQELPQDDQEGNEGTIFGMTIGFSLPPSSYATIALRELTKRPTSSDYQSKLEVSGKCERNINFTSAT